MFSADHFSVPHKKYLGYRIQSIVRQGNDIFILSPASCDFLPFSDFFDITDGIPQSRRFLKAKFHGSLLHLLFQLTHHLLIISVEEIQHAPHLFSVLLLAHIPLTGRLALFHMIIQTGSFFSLIPGQHFMAGTDLIQFPQQFNTFLNRARTCIGAEIPGFVFFHFPGKQYSRVRLLYRDLDKRIGLVILQHGIVFWPMFFDQITFQHQCFQFRIGDDILKPRNMSDHFLDFRSFVAAALKILADTVFKTDGLSHIDDGILSIVHDIYAGFSGQFFQFFFDVEFCSHILSFLFA